MFGEEIDGLREKVRYEESDNMSNYDQHELWVDLDPATTIRPLTAMKVELNKYLMVTDRDPSGEIYEEIIEGLTPEAAFERWLIEEYLGFEKIEGPEAGMEWVGVDFEEICGYFREVKLMPVTSSDMIRIDYPAFVARHDARPDDEKDPEYLLYVRLCKKFRPIEPDIKQVEGLDEDAEEDEE
jgi:hypothetical protein